MLPDSIVIVSLHTPKEKLWGSLASMNSAGVTVRAIDLNSFDDFIRQVLDPEGERIGLPTLFFPIALSAMSLPPAASCKEASMRL